MSESYPRINVRLRHLRSTSCQPTAVPLQRLAVARAVRNDLFTGSAMNRLLAGWHHLRASFWFTPALIAVFSMAAAVTLVEIDAWKTAELAQWSPRLFGAGADGSRAMLSAIATSMITVAGVVFSITIVTLSLTSTQYSPRVLRNFMRDGPTQVVLGVFVGIFCYCLIVLRTIRGPDDGDFIPSLAVLGGMAYALCGIALLIYFIHHVAQSIQASSILARIAADTTSAIDHLFPEKLGDASDPQAAAQALPERWSWVRSGQTGYVVNVDGERLMDMAQETGHVFFLRAGVGDFVAQGAPLIGIDGHTEISDEQEGTLLGCLVLDRQRTVDQDPAFGLQQLVDVAVKALSPGINDPTTACMCVDQLGALLARLASRRMPPPYRMKDGRLRVVAPAPDFASLLSLGLGTIVHHSRGDLQVLDRILRSMQVIRGAALTPRRSQEMAPLVEDLRLELHGITPAARASPLLRRLRDFAI